MLYNKRKGIITKITDGGDVIVEFKINLNAVNQFSKGTAIYTEGEPVSSVALVLKGRVKIYNCGAQIIVNSGSFLALNDLYVGRFQSTYEAYDDLIIYVFSISRREDLEILISSNKDYHGLMVAYYNRVISDLDGIYEGLINHGTRLYQFLTDNYKEYLDLAARLGCKVKTEERFKTLTMIENDLEHLRDKINYYKECKSVPLDVVKSFYSYSNVITLYQVEDQINLVNLQIELMKSLSEEVVTLVERLIDEEDTCLFRLVASLALELDKVNSNNSEVVDLMDCIIEEINSVDKFFERLVGQKLKIDRNRMEEVYHLLLTGSKKKGLSTAAQLKYASDDSEQALLEMKDSYGKILEYAEVEVAKANEMKKALLDFVNLKDKFAVEDSSRLIRKQISESHYELYKKVFVKAYKDKKVPRIIEMFLELGYADERLLTQDQLLSLYFLKGSTQEGPCKVYNIREWLTLIYEGKKEPSKNEFDLNYPEMLASLKRQGKLKDKDILEWMKNADKKLDYEIENMFRYNNRITNGKISTFVPILYKEVLSNNMDKLYVTSDDVNNAINDLLRIDFSIFDREALYVNKEKKIEKEYIMKRVYPDIILLPTFGSNGVMWQDITGKKRDSEGRFLLPIFTDTGLASIMTKIFGRFRWELCRSIQGLSWNDIKYKSLTSEYSDYLQFYRKNKELSEEKKEKVKLQIQKGRNNSRDIFTIDYEQWINYESNGAIKLNKPVREIMATYCPFAKTIRDRQMKQPLFEDAMARYNKNKLTKIKELEARHRYLQKEHIELTQELIDTLNYHKEM